MSTTATEKMAAATTPRHPARAEHVGSLLRPAALKRLVEETYEPGHSALLEEERAKDLSALHAAEDEAIREAVRRQLDVGLDVVSDGEFRRFMFTGSFYDAVDGLGAGTGEVPFTNEEGEVEFYTGLPVVEGELHTIDSPGAQEAAFVASLTDHPFKVTFPAASIFWFPLAYVHGVTDKVYPTQAEMVDRMIEIQRAQVAEAIAAGASYVQFDWPVYPALGDAAAVAMLREHGVDPGLVPRPHDRGRPQGDRGDPRRRHDGAAPLPRQPQVEVDLQRPDGRLRRAHVQRAALRRVPDGVGGHDARGRLLGAAPRPRRADRRDGRDEQQEAARRDGRRAGPRDRGGQRATSTSITSRSRRSAGSRPPTSATR